ncbi:unnamed protein product [Phytomonas sp. EM1]|nr:unnamed protein product [Phytomonas sp. EM1]|eukprot:CCW60083.1 unnamed protein product [Phytomonas sp. isolate EM1]
METLEYPSWILNDAERLYKLKCAVCAFVAEPVTRHDLHVIALVVSVSPLSEVLASVQRSQNSGSCSEVTRKGKVSSHLRLKHRRELKRVAAQQCCTGAESCLYQALRDAQLLAFWLNETFFFNTHTQSDPHASWCGCSKGISMGIEVVVMASLVPRTIPDLALFMAWQQGLEAQRHSPLRYAALLRISFGNSLFFQNWMSYYSRIREQSTAAKSQAAVGSLELSSMVQPHQALLIDIEWYLEAAIGSQLCENTRRSYTILEKQTSHRIKSESQKVTADKALHAFFNEIHTLIKLPQEGKVAMWLPYSYLLSECFTGSYCQCARNTLNNAPYQNEELKTQYDQLYRECVQCTKFKKLSREIRSLYSRLHECFGQTKSFKLITSNGETINELLDKANLVEIPVSQADTRKKAVTTAKLHGTASFSPCNGIRDTVLTAGTTKAISPSPLLCTRSLRDAYALLGLFVGLDAVGFYAGGVAFCRGIERRLCTARVGGLASGLGKVVLGARVGKANASGLVSAIDNVRGRKGAERQDFICGNVDLAKKENTTDSDDLRSPFVQDMHLCVGRARDASLQMSQHTPFGGKRPRHGNTSVEGHEVRVRVL